MVLTIIRLALLCLSVYGAMRYFGRRIAPELAIGFTFAAIGSVIFFAGLLNLLDEATLAVFLGGLVCLGLTLREDRKVTISAGGIFLLAACAFLAFRLWGGKLIYIDNFTHWEVAVRHLLAKHRFPNFQDSYIRFQSYPLGTASLIYYFTRVSGIEAEWFQALVQWACAAGMLSGLFCLAKSVPARAACFLGATLLFCADNDFNQLLVDTMLGVTALSAAAFCVYYRDDLRRKAAWLLPWLIYLVAVKNSGALFALFVAALVFAWGGWRGGLMVTAVSLLTLLLWNRHVAYVFEQGMLAQHSMSIAHFQQMLAAKRPGSIESIIRKLLGEVLSLSNPYLPVLLISIALFALTAVLAKRVRAVRGLLVYGVACYLIYQAGMLAMYIFTMQEKEALRLASYARYHGTIWIFAAGVALMAALLLADHLAPQPRGRRWAAACCAACVAAMAVSGMPNYSHFTPALDDETLEVLAIRDEADAIIADYALPQEGRYFMLVDDDFTASETAYLYNMANCLLLADDVQTRRLDQIFSEEEVLKYDYLIAFGHSDAIAQYVKDNYGSDARVVEIAEEKDPSRKTGE